MIFIYFHFDFIYYHNLIFLNAYFIVSKFQMDLIFYYFIIIIFFTL
jgi:hypothetical protein